MFSNCTDLEVLDLFDLIANKDSYLYRLFSGCNSLKKLDLSSWSMNGLIAAVWKKWCFHLRLASL